MIKEKIKKEKIKKVGNKITSDMNKLKKLKDKLKK